MRFRLSAIGAVALLLSLLIFFAWSAARHPGRLVTDDRVAEINAELARDGDYVLLAGDSNISLLGNPDLNCGRRTVNAGIVGINAAGYLWLLDRLHFVRRARMALLTLGTNSLPRKRWGDRLPEFRRDVDETIMSMMGAADGLVVTAVPPFAQALEAKLDVDAVERFSEHLRSFCQAKGCIYADPFLALRTSRFGIARDGAMAEGGLHLADYQAPFRAVAPLLCRSTGLTP